MMEPKILSAGVVVVRMMNGIAHFLVLRVFNYWDFPKGQVEPGEHPLDAAIREVAEETGLADLRFHWGEGYRETARYGHGKIARYYIAESETHAVFFPISPELGHPEHQEFRWLTYAVYPRLRLLEKSACSAIDSASPAKLMQHLFD